jgi:hypothetical protein
LGIYWVSDVALRIGNAQVAEAAALEIRSLLFLIVREQPQITGSTRNNCLWYIDAKSQADIFIHAFLPLAVSQTTPTITRLMLSAIRDSEVGVEPVIVPVLPFANARECPFEVLSSFAKSKSSSIKEEGDRMVKKFRNIVQHLAASAHENLSISIMNQVLLVNLSDDTVVQILEETLHQFLKMTEVEYPRDYCAKAIQFPEYMFVHSEPYNRLLQACVRNHTAILLTVLIHKTLDITLQNEAQQTDEGIANAYLYCMDYILEFVPHPQKEDFDIIYVYFMALEMIDTQYWNLSNPAIADRTSRFEQSISFLSTKYSNWTKKIGKFVPAEMKEMKISPSTCLACNAVGTYLHQLISQKRQSGDIRGGLLTGYENSSNVLPVMTGNNPKYVEMIKLREKKEFKESFALFFQQAKENYLDHEEFRAIVMTLFPLAVYLGRV